VVDIDDAMKWGFGWELGPFETWDALGVAATVARMEAAGLVIAPWVQEMLRSGHATFYRFQAATLQVYDPLAQGYTAVERSLRALPLRVVKQARPALASNASASLLDMGDGVLLL